MSTPQPATASRLLIDESPLQVLPSLATAIGLNEAIILQQVQYWISGGKSHERDGHLWIYNSIPQWQENFPWWSESTIKRALHNLREKGLLIVANFNKAGFDKTLWYRIDYDALREIETAKRMTRRSGQNDPTSGSDRPDGKVNLTRPIPETTTEITTETTLVEDLGRVRAAPSGQQPTPAPAKPPAAGVASSKPAIDLRQAQVIVSEEPEPPTPADLADRQKKDFAPGVDVGQAPPGRLVKPGTGKDAYWILREYTVKGLTSHQIRAIRDTVKDLTFWRQVCARWAEVYGDDWRKFGHLDWYRGGIPGETPGKPASPADRGLTKAERSMAAVDRVFARLAEQGALDDQ